MAEYNRKLEQQAALEATTIAAPDAFPAHDEHIAAREASEMAAPDISNNHRSPAEIYNSHRFGSFDAVGPVAYASRGEGAGPTQMQAQTPNHDALITIDPLAAALVPSVADMSGGRSQGDLSTSSTFSPYTTISPEATGSEEVGWDRERGEKGGVKEEGKERERERRPTLSAGQDHQSVTSISQLHVPGEYPRSNEGARDAVGRLPV